MAQEQGYQSLTNCTTKRLLRTAKTKQLFNYLAVTTVAPVGHVGDNTTTYNVEEIAQYYTSYIN